MEEVVNKVVLRGRIGSVRELNTQLCKTKRFALSTQEVYKNLRGEVVAETQWHNVAAFDKEIEEGFEYIQTGIMIELEGRLKYVRYINADGIEKTLTEIKATKVKVL